MKKDKKNYIVYNKLIIFFILFCFAIIAERAIELSLLTEIDGINLQKFASNRNTVDKILLPARGTIYDFNGNELAINVNSYTVIAYLEETRSTEDNIRHVVDKEAAAEALSPIINMTKEEILDLLEKDLYQVELGPGGRGLSEIRKDEIMALELPGIDLIKTVKRYYPESDFAAYTLGYAKKDEEGFLVGELGIESYFNKKLSGTKGTLQYQKDNRGYKIPGTPEIRKDAIDGYDVYLTIDRQVQLFVDRAVKEVSEKYDPEWLTVTVADAKTGAILANTSKPSFDPNIKNIEIYENRMITSPYEPGSTMKTFTYMAVMENGTYEPKTTFESGKIKIYDDTISDWYKPGFGIITFDEGYVYSSNVGVATLTQDYISKEKLMEYYKLLGFGSNTNITLPREKPGVLNFTYPIEVASAGFGQGITTTPIQNIKALTSIANDGILLEPYIVDKIVDPNTKKIIFEGKKKEVATVASLNTIKKIKSLMYEVVNGTERFVTGKKYSVEGYDLIGKTGTAQVYDNAHHKYYDHKYIYSFSGMYPYNDPKIIIYISMESPKSGGSYGNSEIVKNIVKDTAMYYGIFEGSKEVDSTTITVDQYINKDAENIIIENAIILGDGNKIINQYPEKGTIINKDNKIYLVTNYNEIKMPDILKWSKKDFLVFADLIDLKYESEGNGYVYSQSIKKGTILTKEDVLEVIFKDKNYFE